MSAHPIGTVYLVGAGPGDPELITLKGKRCLEAADVILYDELANTKLLSFARHDATLVYVGKKAGVAGAEQQEIEARLIAEARAGKNVVRLKGGDPFLFGRGGEEAQALAAAAIPFVIVPGVSSAFAVPAYAGIPITQRGYASSVAIVTGHKVSGEQSWGALVTSVDTLIILMGRQNLSRIMARLLACGCDPQRPCAVIESGTLSEQSQIIGTVGTFVNLTEPQAFGPSLIIVGEVVKLGRDLHWYRTVARGFTQNASGMMENALEMGTV